MNIFRVKLIHKADTSSLRVESLETCIFWYFGNVFFPYVPSYKNNFFLFTNKVAIQNRDIMRTQFAFKKPFF